MQVCATTESQPVQPAKVEPEFAVAARLMTVAVEKFAEQLLVQSIPEGMLVTVPSPAPAKLTLRLD